MKIEWLIANVTAAGSPDRAERDILVIILDFFAEVHIRRGVQVASASEKYRDAC